MGSETEPPRYLALRSLSHRELEKLKEAIDRALERYDSTDESLNWFGAFQLGQSVRDELQKRRQQYPDDGTMDR